MPLVCTALYGSPCWVLDIFWEWSWPWSWMWELGLVICWSGSPESKCWLVTAASETSKLLVLLITPPSKGLGASAHLGLSCCLVSWRLAPPKTCALTLSSQVLPSWRKWRRHRARTLVTGSAVLGQFRKRRVPTQALFTGSRRLSWGQDRRWLLLLNGI